VYCSAKKKLARIFWQAAETAFLLSKGTKVTITGKT